MINTITIGQEAHEYMAKEYFNFLSRHSSAKMAAGINFSYLSQNLSIDMIEYFPSVNRLSDTPTLSITQVYPVLFDLNESIKDYNIKMSKFPELFRKRYNIKEKTLNIFGNLILLQSLENVSMIQKNYHIFENLFTYKKNMTDGSLRIDNLFFFDPLRSSKTQSRLSIFVSKELIGEKSPGWDKKSYCYKNISNFIKIYRDKINT